MLSARAAHGASGVAAVRASRPRNLSAARAVQAAPRAAAGAVSELTITRPDDWRAPRGALHATAQLTLLPLPGSPQALTPARWALAHLCCAVHGAGVRSRNRDAQPEATGAHAGRRCSVPPACAGCGAPRRGVRAADDVVPHRCVAGVVCVAGARRGRLSCAAALIRSDNTTPADIAAAAASGFVAACKYYPAGATTNSADGVTDVRKARHSPACCSPPL